MASVTQRVNSIQQPRGGYLSIKCFAKETFEDGIKLSEFENIHASLIGIAVDYLTRFMLNKSVDNAFYISTLGAIKLGMQDKVSYFKSNITGLDDLSITAACKLAGFDVCYRSSISGYRPVEDINPNDATINNIRIMVNRSLKFWEKYGPVVHSEPTFEGGYLTVVNTGDGDYVTNDTLWDFKVSKTAPTTKHTLQILMYYIMGLHSIHEHLKKISNLGFFNPRLNMVYICPISNISSKIIEEIENNVICYNFSNVPKEDKCITNTTTNKITSCCKNYTVADVCITTQQKKSEVYSDIRSGKLLANKKGNKYIIPQEEFNRYIVYIKTMKKVKLITVSIFCVVTVIFMFILLGNIFSLKFKFYKDKHRSLDDKIGCFLFYNIEL